MSGGRRRTGRTRDAQHAPGSTRLDLSGLDASSAITRLIDAYGGRIHALALRLCGHQEDARDMVQEVFLQAFRKWSTFRGDADPGTWLFAIALRSCKDRARRKGGINRRIPALSQLMPWSESTVMEIAAAPDGSVDRAERDEAIERVQRSIASLPEHLRAPLMLKEVLGIDVREVGEVLGLAENTVKSRLHRARLALRKALTSVSSSVEAPAPIYEKQVCLDLLKAKMSALDRGLTGPASKIPQAELCDRCRAVFKELDLVQDACARLSEGRLPAGVRTALIRAINARDEAEHDGKRLARRGRKPVRRSGVRSL